MGRWCKVCGCIKANESFSGRGHKTHICKACKAMPAAERDAITQRDELYGFMAQNNISAKNIARLRVLEASPDAELADIARLVLQVALVKPRSRRRLGFLAAGHPTLLLQLRHAGLIIDDDDFSREHGCEEDQDFEPQKATTAAT